MLLTTNILTTLYTIYLIVYFYGETLTATETTEMIGGAIATALVTPHIIMFFLGAIFGWVGYFITKNWATLVAAILYSVGTVLFPMYAIFGIPLLTLGFISYHNQKKINIFNI